MFLKNCLLSEKIGLEVNAIHILSDFLCFFLSGFFYENLTNCQVFFAKLDKLSGFFVKTDIKI